MEPKKAIAGILLAGSLLLASATHAEFRKWVDENGHVHITNIPPETNSRAEAEKRGEDLKRTPVGVSNDIRSETQNLIINGLVSQRRLRQEVNQFKVNLVPEAISRRYIDAVTAHIVKNLKDPWSYRVYDAFCVRQGPYFKVGIDYGAKNSLGGYVRKTEVYVFRDEKIVYTE